MTIEEAIQVAERLEREDCIGTTSQALRALLRAYKRLQEAETMHGWEESARHAERTGGTM